MLSGSSGATGYDHVGFLSADLRGAVVLGARFAGCEFDKANLRKVEFYGCRIEGCRFSGVLDEVTFHEAGLSGSNVQGSLNDVDFSGAEFRFVQFRHFDLEGVRLPESSANVVFEHFGCALAKAVREIESSTDPDTRWLLGVLQSDLEWIVPGQRRGVIAVSDLHPTGTVRAGAAAADWLRRLDRDCASS